MSRGKLGRQKSSRGYSWGTYTPLAANWGALVSVAPPHLTHLVSYIRWRSRPNLVRQVLFVNDGMEQGYRFRGKMHNEIYIPVNRVAALAFPLAGSVWIGSDKIILRARLCSTGCSFLWCKRVLLGGYHHGARRGTFWEVSGSSRVRLTARYWPG